MNTNNVKQTKATGKRRTLPERLLDGTSLTATDASRLVLETIEMLGSKVNKADKEALLILLRRVLHAGVVSIREAECTVTFAQAVHASVTARSGRRPVTVRDLRHFTNRMLRVEGFADRPLRGMTVRECRTLLQLAFGSSLHSYRKGRAILHSIFAFGVRQEWCDRNPVDCIESPKVQERLIEPLSPAAVQQLERVALRPKHRQMQLSLYLMLYCGVRPNEVQRINPETDIDWKTRQVLIRPENSKTGGGRVIPLRKARHVCRDCRRTIPPNWIVRWRNLRKAAGFRRWQPDVCRHTFATYHAQKFRNLPQLQIEMGHRNTELLRSRYVMAQLGNNACEFWK